MNTENMKKIKELRKRALAEKQALENQYGNIFVADCMGMASGYFAILRFIRELELMAECFTRNNYGK